MTEPSIEFSIGTSASGTSPVAHGAGSSRPPSGRAPPRRRRRPRGRAAPPRRRCRAARGSRSSRRHAGGSGGRSARRRPDSSGGGGAAPPAGPAAPGGRGRAPRPAPPRGRAAGSGAPSTSCFRYTRAWSRAWSEVTTAPVLVAVEQGDRPRLLPAHVAVGVVAHQALEAQRRAQARLGRPRPGARPGLEVAEALLEPLHWAAAARPGGRPGPADVPSGSSTCWAARSRRSEIQRATQSTSAISPGTPAATAHQTRPPSDRDLDRVLGRVVIGVGLAGHGGDLDPQRALLAEDRRGRGRGSRPWSSGWGRSRRAGPASRRPPSGSLG